MSKTMNMNVDQDGIAVIEIDVQDRPMNVITVDFADEFKNCVEEITKDEIDIGILIATSPDKLYSEWINAKDNDTTSHIEKTLSLYSKNTC